jgi:hypothetical protein
MTQIEKFLKEKMYLQNVSSCTLDWYTHALKKLPSEQHTGAIKQSGNQPTGIWA